MKSDEELEGELAGLLEVERFEPPREFRENARLSDPAVYGQAGSDPLGWWTRQAEELHWVRTWEQVLDRATPRVCRWFVGGSLNASYNFLDRRVEAGIGDRVAFHWRGEQGEERAITYADLHRDVQRLANALKDLGVGKGDVVVNYPP